MRRRPHPSPLRCTPDRVPREVICLRKLSRPFWRPREDSVFTPSVRDHRIRAAQSTELSGSSKCHLGFHPLFDKENYSYLISNLFFIHSFLRIPCLPFSVFLQRLPDVTRLTEITSISCVYPAWVPSSLDFLQIFDRGFDGNNLIIHVVVV